MNALRLKLRGARERRRYARWIRTLRIELERQGGRLVVETAARPRLLADVPYVRAVGEGDGSGTLTLRIGRGVLIGPGLSLEVWARTDTTLELGDEVQLEDATRIHLRGGAVRLGRATITRGHCLLKSDGELVTGEATRVGHGSVVHCSGRVELGDHAVVAESATVIDSDHTWDEHGTPFLQLPIAVEPVTIGANSLVAAGARVTRGVTLGPGSLVAAGAVLTRGDYPAGSVLGGVPARSLKPPSG
ncbi:MAG: acyltransferase [Solirubrobacteraceae bacterium]